MSLPDESRFATDEQLLATLADAMKLVESGEKLSPQEAEICNQVAFEERLVAALS